MTGACIANPGLWPELHEVATGFFRHRQLGVLITTIDPRSNVIIRAGTRLPGRVGDFVTREAAKRDLGEMSRFTIERATLLDLAQVMAYRTTGRSRLMQQLLRWRDVTFDTSVAKLLHPSTTLYFGHAGAAEASLTAARQLGIMTVLNWNIQHWSEARRCFEEEAERNPAWAPLFTFGNFSRGHAERLDREIELADRIFVPSSAVAESFTRIGVPTSRLIIVPYGVDSERFRPAWAAPREFRVVCVGEIGQRKGLSYTFEAARRLPHIPFDVVGWRVGPLPEPAPPNVSIFENVASVIPYLQRASVFLFPSLLDGFGLAVLQGLACGLPAICSERAGARDVIREGQDGFVVPAADVEATVGHLDSLSRDTDRVGRMRLSARERAEQLSWERFHDTVVARVNEERDVLGKPVVLP